VVPPISTWLGIDHRDWGFPALPVVMITLLGVVLGRAFCGGEQSWHFKMGIVMTMCCMLASGAPVIPKILVKFL
jgi:hypothetical protein